MYINAYSLFMKNINIK
jgi:hypothetical protein